MINKIRYLVFFLVFFNTYLLADLTDLTTLGTPSKANLDSNIAVNDVNGMLYTQVSQLSFHGTKEKDEIIRLYVNDSVIDDSNGSSRDDTSSETYNLSYMAAGNFVGSEYRFTIKREKYVDINFTKINDDISSVRAVYNTAINDKETADSAVEDASTAQEQADKDAEDATTAKQEADTQLAAATTAKQEADTQLAAAVTAKNEADSQLAAARTVAEITAAKSAVEQTTTTLTQANTAAETAQTILTQANTAATAAQTTLTQANTDATTAQATLTQANTDAAEAAEAADAALADLNRELAIKSVADNKVNEAENRSDTIVNKNTIDVDGFVVGFVGENRVGIHTGLEAISESSPALIVVVDIGAAINISSVTRAPLTASGNYDDVLTEGYRISIETDLKYDLNASITSTDANETIVPFLNGSAGIFLKVSDNFVDGEEYNVTFPSGLVDKAGNVASTNSIKFRFDKVANEKEYARAINLNEDYTGYLDKSDSVEADENDYFLLHLARKGKLSLDTDQTQAKVKLLDLSNTSIADSNSSSLTKLLERGSYLVQIYGIYVGAYTLSPNFISYEDEIDEDSMPNVQKKASKNDFTYQEQLYIDRIRLQTSSFGSNSFTLNENSISTINNSATFDSILNSAANHQHSFDHNINSFYIVGNTAYILNATQSQIHEYDLSDITNIGTAVIKKLPTLNSNTSVYDEMLIDDNGNYAYILDSSKHLYIYDIKNADTTVEALETANFKDIEINDFSLYNGVLYLGGDDGIFMFDIHLSPGTLKFLKKIPSEKIIALAGYEGKLHTVEEGTNVATYSYEILFDYDDNITQRSLVNKLELNTTVNMNKYSGKNDIDIFRVDLEHSGTLELISSDVNTSNLTITIADNEMFTSPLSGGNNVSFINKTITLSKLSAKSYFIKIESNDTDTFDDYRIQNIFTKNSATDVKDALLSISLAEETSFVLNTDKKGTLETDNDVDIFKFKLEVEGIIDLNITNSKTATINQVVIEDNENYLSLQEVTNTVLESGIYYIKVSGSSGAYTLHAKLQSFVNTDEYQNSLFVNSIVDITGDPEKQINVNVNNDFFTEFMAEQSNRLRVDSNISFDGLMGNKTYFSQVSDGKYIYGLYRNENNSSELGIDTILYINQDYSKVVASKIIAVTSAQIITNLMNTYNETLVFNEFLKIYDSTLIFNDSKEWREYNITNPLSIEETSEETSVFSIDSKYKDFIIEDDYIYAITSSEIDKISRDTKVVVSPRENNNSIASFTIIDDNIYLATTDKGILVYKKTDLSYLRSITNIRNTTAIKNMGTNLLMQSENRDFYTIEIDKDIADYFAGAKLLSVDESITGGISSGDDIDIYKVSLNFSGKLGVELSGGVVCELYDDALEVVAGDCNQDSIAAGDYSFKLSKNTSSEYSLKVTHIPLAEDIADTSKFFDGNITSYENTTQNFRSKIDISGDTDYFKIKIEESGELEINSLADIDFSVVHENGEAVTGFDGTYSIVDSGEYFIKVTSNNSVEYDLNTSFTPISSEEYIDNADITTSSLFSQTDINVEGSIMISNAKILYVANEKHGVNIFNIDNPLSPVITSRVDLLGTPKRLYLDGTILYVALGIDGFAMIDVSDPSRARLLNQVDISENILSIAAEGTTVYIAAEDKLLKYNVSKFTSPSLIIDLAIPNIKQILLEKELWVSTAESLEVRDKDTLEALEESKKIEMNASLVILDENLLFANVESSKVSIYNTEDTITLVKPFDLNTSVNSFSVNNKVLYIATPNGYTTINYKDSLLPVEESADINVSSLSGIDFIDNMIVTMSSEGSLDIYNGVPDYADTRSSIKVIKKDLNASRTGELLGQFSRKIDDNGNLIADTDVFKLLNLYKSGDINISNELNGDINITLLDSAGNLIESSKDNRLDLVIHEGDYFLSLSPLSNKNQFSYKIQYEYNTDNDKEVNLIDLNNSEINNGISSNLYYGKDKDFYRLDITKTRSDVNLKVDGEGIKISLFYPSEVLIAGNIDDNDNIQKDMNLTLEVGEYYLLVENNNTNYTGILEYNITTKISNTSELILESGIRVDDFEIDAYAYTGKYIYSLKDGVLFRMNTTLDILQEIKIDNNNTDSNNTNELEFNIFAYSDKSEENVYIHKFDQNEHSLFTVSFNKNGESQLVLEDNDILEISDGEKLLFIDNQSYIYYYDQDTLTIQEVSDVNNLDTKEYENIVDVFEKDGIMYVLSDSKIELYKIEKNENVSMELLSSIVVSNPESIYVEKNKLFVGASSLFHIYNIEGKEKGDEPELLKTRPIEFIERDNFYYEGKVTSMYKFEDKLYTTVVPSGMIVFNMDSNNTIDEKHLNLGENITDIYTFDGNAINYVVTNDNKKLLKVEFLNKLIGDPDSSGNYTVIEDNELQEGCFIATAAYGSYFEPNVKILRDFRDNYLLTNSLGKLFVDFYYEHSPEIANDISKNEFAKSAVRVLLSPLVYIIKYTEIFMFIFLFFIGMFMHRKIQQKNLKHLGEI